MNSIDIVMLICLIPAVIRGLSKGLVIQVISLMSIYVGAMAAFRLGPVASSYVGQLVSGSEKWVNILSFILIMTIVILFMRLAGKVINSTVKAVSLGWINRILGVVFALLSTIVILGIIITVFESLNSTFGLVSAETISASVLYEPVKTIANNIFPYIKEWLEVFSL